MKKILRQTVSILACMWLFAACSDDAKNETPVTISVDRASLEMFVGDVEVITASPTSETFEWKSNNPAVATVSGGTVTAMGAGETSIVVSCRDAKEVTIPVTVKVKIPVTEISVSPSSLTLLLPGTATLTASLLPANHNESNTTLLWQSSHPAVATVNAGVVEAVDYGAATITVTLEGNPSIKAEVPVSVSRGIPVVDVSTFVESGIPNVLQSQVSFTKDEEFLITGIEESEIAAAYNRDFFDYNAGTLTFTGETGTWDVFYSSRYHYFWVGKMDDVAPATYWLMGAGFSCPPVWNSDFNGIGADDWTDIRMLAYMKKVDENRYQVTIYISPSTHGWGDSEMQIWPGRNIGPRVDPSGATLTGDTSGMSARNWGLLGLGVGGYYRITFDLSGGWSAATIHFEKLN
jgi:hypothetical protein